MYLTTKALVLRVTDYSDRDCLLTLLTPQHGKLTAKARGLRRKNSPLTAPCQLLAYGEYTLFENKGSYIVNEAVSVELFHGLRTDLEKLSLATYFAQASELMSQEDLPNPEVLSLTLNCLYALSHTKISKEMVKVVFEMRLASLSGYMPDLSGCYRCGRESDLYFDISEGRLECAQCRDSISRGIRLPVSDAAVNAMRYITQCDPGKIFSFTLGTDNLIQLSQVTEAFLSTQVERGFSALDFYKSLQLGDNYV